MLDLMHHWSIFAPKTTVLGQNTSKQTRQVLHKQATEQNSEMMSFIVYCEHPACRHNSCLTFDLKYFLIVCVYTNKISVQ